jgi:hypothetical protein
MRLVEWIKRNKFSSLLLVLILVYLVQNFFASSVVNYSGRSMMSPSLQYSDNLSQGVQKVSPANSIDISSQNRLVQRESSLSLLVKDVKTSADIVIKQAEGMGGFMIQSSFSNPGEAPSGSISMRVPSSKLAEYLEILRKQSIRVVSEDLSGTDITDQYKDINSRLDTLNATKIKFEAIYQKAVTIPDILEVQNRIIELQDQIDSLKGQQQYVEKSSEMAKVTVYLSTDELSLPYVSSTSWRPSVVFKAAVRSLVENLRGFASFLIWIGVYVVFWGPALIIILLVKRYRQKKLLR